MTTESKSYAQELQKKYGRISFGRFLASWRESEEMTQAAFAKRIGISAANLCDLEQGRRIPSPTRAKQIAKKLKLPEKALVTLAIQDTLEKHGMEYQVELSEVA